MLSDLLFRLRAILRGRAIERELDDEIQFHLERDIDRHMARGLSREAASREARLAFGGVDQIKEDCRDARGITLVETVVHDVRYGVRTLRRAPIFAITAVATLALSTAGLATVFTLGHTLLVRRLAVERPDEMVIVSATRGRPGGEGLVSYPDYVAFRDRATTVRGLAAHYPTSPLFVTASGNAREINGAVVSANYFELLGLQPARGRFFRASEDEVPDRDRVAILGHALWRAWFGAAPEAIGASVRINGTDFTVIGVAPASFTGLRNSPIEIYIPTMMLRVGYRWCDDSLASDCTILGMIGRLAPGRTLPEAAAEFNSHLPASWRHAKVGENSGIAVSAAAGVAPGEANVRLVRILAGVAVVLLLVCCANLAGLLASQCAARAGEFGIRMALGAPAGRVIRQLMTESLMLAVAGGLAGVVISRGLIAVLSAMFYATDAEGHPLAYDFSLTTPVMLAAVGAAILVGCVFSAVPAMRAVRRGGAVSVGQRTATARWSAAAWLLGGQAAIAVALVAVTGLLAASAHLVVTGANFDPSHVALMRLRPRLMKYPPERARRFQRQVVERLAAVPGVESVSMVGVGVVLLGSDEQVGLPGWTRDQGVRAGYNEIGPRYFETLRTPLVGGREFDDRDTLDSPRVAVVNATLARQLWPARGAVGATIVIGGTPHQVVGVAGDVGLRSRTEADQPYVYTAFWQNARQIDSRLCIRVAGDPAAMLATLVREVNRVDPDVPIAETITLPFQMAGLVRPLRLSATFIAYAAGLAVLLTAIGLYGTLAFAVSRRTKEIGVRMALGAARSCVLGLIVREGMTVILIGVFVGIGLGVAGSRVVDHLLYRAAPADWLFYTGAALLIATVGLLASWLPARRAAAVEPLVALRHE